ncbi:MAG: 5-carboxymethyl-2-hydroxymuconate Delta-isomerase [Rickettsiales bacterium]|nr:5-carboxymethyl-2-hydroxymuconate Delta-isomerase [Pseudomonadota bacterium]MDA0967122.1 5-carboxymethyl-2-hydroxymuconate Delta-isomerase [Pseudomonadota bacterium]MDG4542392.1 5-carboxymethyl-2-hydroxymuconate Delta-isomerase [Rickettsiales bacterium]MDG4544896.1 5-carboxymethyl-2-hydroxymuconate Delta-isomerase [Rickettsiales bacterium]MDG4547019.1 5-carboxymethyl-2-hydroxymuconate Delta-isomerase [Rickettsiales bacterium]
MPHIIIEYSDNLKKDIKDSSVTEKLHKAVTESGLFSPDAVKARAIGYSDYVLPEGAKSFIHITVSILEGKSTGQKASLSNSVFDTARKAIASCDKLSVDIREMETESYRK